MKTRFQLDFTLDTDETGIGQAIGMRAVDFIEGGIKMLYSEGFENGILIVPGAKVKITYERPKKAAAAPTNRSKRQPVPKKIPSKK